MIYITAAAEEISKDIIDAVYEQNFILKEDLWVNGNYANNNYESRSLTRLLDKSKF